LLQATEIAQLGLDRGLRLLGRRRPRPGLLTRQHDLGIQRASSKPRRRSDATQAVGGLLQAEQVAAEPCAGRGDDLKVFDLALADGGARFLLQPRASLVDELGARRESLAVDVGSNVR